MKVFIGVGHGGSDPGAVANGLAEEDVNLNVALAMQAELLRHDVKVGMSRLKDENDPLAEEIAECNAFNPDCAVEVHANAGKGDGFEVFYQTNTYRSKSYAIAEAIEKQVTAIGQNTRGCKTRTSGSPVVDYYGWLRQVKCPAILCEAAFLDNKTDVQIIDTKAEQEVFGIAYAKGVLAYLGVAYKEPSDDMYGVMKQVIALSTEDKAKAYAASLNAKNDGAYYKVMKV